MTRYMVEAADRVEIDRAEAKEYLVQTVPEYAELWDEALSHFLENLAEFPGPHSYAIDRNATHFFGRETRRALFYGPTRSRSGTPYRVYFSVSGPDADDEYGVIRVLRILHGAQKPLGSETGSDPE